jgi:hypothetical protein
MSELNIQIAILNNQATIIGNVVGESLEDGSITIENPCYIVPTQTAFQLIKVLEAAGVAIDEKTVTIKPSDLQFGRLYPADEGLADGWKQTFGYAVIEKVQGNGGLILDR